MVDSGGSGRRGRRRDALAASTLLLLRVDGTAALLVNDRLLGLASFTRDRLARGLPGSRKSSGQQGSSSGGGAEGI